MSLKGDKYETAEEVKSRLEGSVVMYDGKPVYITRVSSPDAVEDKKEIARVFFKELPLGKNAKETRKFLSSRNFDLTPFPMGYMNFDRSCLFVSRNPVRQYKQGLTRQNVQFTAMAGERVRHEFGDIIAEQSFTDMLNGKYPNFKDVGDILEGKDGITAVAVSRNFAFCIDQDIEALLLLHRGVRCGITLKGEKSLRIPAKFHFLKEEMEEARIPIK